MRARHLVGWMLGGALAIGGCNAKTGRESGAEHGQRGALDETAYRGGVEPATVGGGSSGGGSSDQGGSSSGQGGSADQGSSRSQRGSQARGGGSQAQGQAQAQGGASGSGRQRARGAARVQAGEPASSEQRATPQSDYSANQLRDRPEGKAKPGAGQTGAFGGSAPAGGGTALDACERIAEAARGNDAAKLGELTAGDALEPERVRKAFFETWSSATCSDLEASGDHATVKVVTGERGVPSSIQTVPFIKIDKGWVLDSDAYVARYPKEMVSPQHHPPGEPAKR